MIWRRNGDCFEIVLQTFGEYRHGWRSKGELETVWELFVEQMANVLSNT